MISNSVKLAVIATLAAAIIASVYVANLALTSPVDPNLSTPQPSNSPSATVSSTPSPSPTQNNSAIYTFTVTPTITSYESYWNDSGKIYETNFHVNAEITWDKNQAPYVRYYEITPHFNGNTQPTQKMWGGTAEFREWGLKSWATLEKSNWVENEIYFLGSGAINYPDPSHYAGIFDDKLEWIEEGLHGVVIGSMKTTYDWYFDDAGATEGDLAKTEQAMLEYAQSYYEGWTFTVKPVS
ncbi:MAG: hypothetical protein ACFCUE_11115 [Candidatus Bathyarchaeia archaeon]|jgi:hypothetical protein